MSNTIKWQYGVTTVPSRKDNLLIKTLTSLKEAGFNTPHLYIDGAYDGYGHIGPNLQKAGITYRSSKIGVYGNWILSMLDLYIREPNADRYAIFQDDFVILPRTREYIDSCLYPELGYLNLYSQTPQNEVLFTKENNRLGWYVSNQMGRGAVALVFNNATLRSLMTTPKFMQYILDKPKWADKSDRNLDGVLIECLKPLNIKEYIHNPSLVQHKGIPSTIGNNSCSAKTFNSEFDLMSILK